VFKSQALGNKISATHYKLIHVLLKVVQRQYNAETLLKHSKLTQFY